MECPFVDLLPKLHGGQQHVTKLGRKHNQDVFQCVRCGLVMSPPSDPEAYMQLYTDPKRYFNLSVVQGYTGFEDRFQHDYQIAEVRVRNILKHIVGKVSLLDIGCGNGAFVQRAHEEGFTCKGVDLDEWMLAQAKFTVKDVKFHKGEIVVLKFATTFDVITFLDSFEHLLNPRAYVQEVSRILKPGGLVMVETPDVVCDDFPKKATNWRHVKPSEHPFLYSEHHIEALFGTANMTIIDQVYTIPGRCLYFIRKV